MPPGTIGSKIDLSFAYSALLRTCETTNWGTMLKDSLGRWSRAYELYLKAAIACPSYYVDGKPEAFRHKTPPFRTSPLPFHFASCIERVRTIEVIERFAPPESPKWFPSWGAPEHSFSSFPPPCDTDGNLLIMQSEMSEALYLYYLYSEFKYVYLFRRKTLIEGHVLVSVNILKGRWSVGKTSRHCLTQREIDYTTKCIVGMLFISRRQF